MAKPVQVPEFDSLHSRPPPPAKNRKKKQNLEKILLQIASLRSLSLQLMYLIVRHSEPGSESPAKPVKISLFSLNILSNAIFLN